MIEITSKVRDLIKKALRNGKAFSEVPKIEMAIATDLKAQEFFKEATVKDYQPQAVTERRVKAEWGKLAKAYRQEQAQKQALRARGFNAMFVRRLTNPDYITNSWQNRLEHKFINSVLKGATVEEAAQELVQHIVKMYTRRF